MPVPLQREQWPVPPHFLQVVIGMVGSKRALAGDGEPGASSRAGAMASSNKTDGVLARAQSWKNIGSPANSTAGVALRDARVALNLASIRQGDNCRLRLGLPKPLI